MPPFRLRSAAAFLRPPGVRNGARGAATLLSIALVVGLARLPAAIDPPPSVADARGVLRLGAADVVLQRRPAGCALAVLAMLARGRGLATDEDALARRAGDRLGPEGLTLAEVRDLASEIGLVGSWWRVAAGDLPSLRAPFAVELAPRADAPAGHLVIVRRVATTGLLIADPASGLEVWPTPAFTAAWTGRVFVPEAS